MPPKKKIFRAFYFQLLESSFNKNIIFKMLFPLKVELSGSSYMCTLGTAQTFCHIHTTHPSLSSPFPKPPSTNSSIQPFPPLLPLQSQSSLTMFRRERPASASASRKGEMIVRVGVYVKGKGVKYGTCVCKVQLVLSNKKYYLNKPKRCNPFS